MRILILIIVLHLLATPLSAQQATSSGQQRDITQEISQMTKSMEELVQLLKAQQAQSSESDELQKLEIAVTYLSFRSRRIEVKEKELRYLKKARNKMEELIAKIKENPEQWERFNDDVHSNNPIAVSFDERQSEYRISQLQERVETLDSDIIKLENELELLTDDLSKFETFVEKKLDLIK